MSLLHQSFHDMLASIPESEATPFLYYVLAWPWTRLAGFGEIGVRSFSALVGAAIVPVAYGAGVALVSRRAGVIAAALVSVHPFLVWYAQEARAYSLFALLAACTVLFFGRALRGGGGWDFLGWALAASLALGTHYFALLLVLPEAAWLLVRAGSRRLATLAVLLPVAVGLAHLPLLLEQRGAGEAVTDASLGVRVAGVPKGLAVGYSFPVEIAGSVLAAVLLATGLVLLVTRAPELRRRALVPGGLAIISICAPVALALAGADYVIVRNAILAIVPAAICVATGYAASRLGLAAGGALCALLLAITLSASLAAGYGRTDWRSAGERLGSPSGARAIVVTPFLSRQLWAEYLPGLEEPSGEVLSVREIAAVGLATEEGFSITGRVKPPALDSGPPPPPPAGFRIVAEERAPTYTLVLYRAPSPTPVSLAQLERLRLADQQPGILVQPAPTG